MGAWFSIDVDALKMFAGYDWWDLGDLCAHGCEHRSTKVVGWGTTVAQYELEECCDCGCRAWRDGRWTKARMRHDGGDGFWHGRMEWRSKAAHSGSSTQEDQTA
jgi:hypothetical protein